MSLENFAAIPDLLADILAEQRATTEAVTKLMETLAGLRTKMDGAAKAAKAVSTKAVAPITDAPAATALTTETAIADPESTPAASAQLDYKADVAPTFGKLLTTKGAPAVVAVLSKFGVKKGVELAPAQLADALAAARFALEQ
jgi:hypothetical protein